MKQYSMATIGTSHTMPIPFNGANTYINFEKLYFNDPLAYFTTGDEKLQEAIETSKFFKSKEIRITGTIEPVAEPEAEVTEEVQEVTEAAPEAEVTEAVQEVTEAAPEAPKQVVHAEVTKFQEAKKLLTAEPYKVTFQALGSPEKILKKAAELGIRFPNLKKDEE